MYTDCPGCQRQFHIYAAQISAAKGLVKCGFCGAQFNALERLRDKPMAQPRPATPAGSRTQPLPEPDFILPDEDGQRAAGRIPADTAETPVTPEPEPNSVAVAGGSPESDTTADAADGGNDPGISPAPATSLSGGYRPATFDFSEAIDDRPAQKSGWFSRLLWALGILMLLAFASTQLIWFNRDAVMSRYPETVPWFNRVCATIDCSAIRHRDLAAIKLLNRDVREHPRYQNALLVNATMSNQSHTLQPYPIVQLNLFDTDGNLIAYRRFQPREYLDESVTIQQGMRPNVPVHFVFEVLDSAAGAVSFEFEFH